jgi:hypothetical protein
MENSPSKRHLRAVTGLRVRAEGRSVQKGGDIDPGLCSLRLDPQ